MKSKKWNLIDNFNHAWLSFYTKRELFEYAKGRGYKAKQCTGMCVGNKYNFYLDNAF